MVSLLSLHPSPLMYVILYPLFLLLSTNLTQDTLAPLPLKIILPGIRIYMKELINILVSKFLDLHPTSTNVTKLLDWIINKNGRTLQFHMV